MVYLSAGEDLAKDQIYSIKNILTGDIYRYYWPEMINDREGDREHWSAYSINVDHPERKRRGIRDHTIIVKTVKSNAIGLHCDSAIFDDVVVPAFAYSESGRYEVSKALSQFSSILNPGGQIKAVGTRYHPKDAYNDMLQATYRVWDRDLEQFLPEEVSLWDVMEKKVEDNGDGTGNFLWPRTHNVADDNWYGFDTQTLEYIKADYQSRGEIAQFFAQYYNDPNDQTTNLLDRSAFRYLDAASLTTNGVSVTYEGNKLHVFAAMDTAWTDSKESGAKRADYTAIAVIGVDQFNRYFVLDLDRFKTSDFNIYYESVMRLANKWGFRKITVESNSAGKIIAKEIERLSREAGGLISVDIKSNAGFGVKSKKLRQYAIVNPKYELGIVYHKKGGLTPELEEELILERPQHDDLVDALGMAMEKAKAPMKHRTYLDKDRKVITDTRFGGRRGR